MDFNGIINKLLKTNSDSRRRQLRTFEWSEMVRGWLVLRHSDVRRGNAEWGMWFYSMGTKYHACASRTSEILQWREYSSLGMCFQFTRRAYYWHV
jgi:hypothetical protein